MPSPARPPFKEGLAQVQSAQAPLDGDGELWSSIHAQVAELVETLLADRLENLINEKVDSRLRMHGLSAGQHMDKQEPAGVDIDMLLMVSAPSGRASSSGKGSVNYGEVFKKHGGRRYQLAGSAWDVMILAWTPAVGCGASVLISLGVILNIIAQLVCSVTAWFELKRLGNFVSEGVEQAALNWRLTEAHSPDRMEKTSWRSLARRTCSKDRSLVFGNVQVGHVEEIEAYTRKFLGFADTGTVLTLGCLFIFGLLIASELTNCLHFFEAVLSIPRKHGRTTFELNSEGGLRVTTISIWRVFLMALAMMVRANVAIMLMIAGGGWLAGTSQLDALLLNCAALAFVLDIDEMLFKIVIPTFVQEVVDKFQAIPLRREYLVRGFSWRTLLAIIGCVIFVALEIKVSVLPMRDRMMTVKNTMCDPASNLDFVVDVNQHLGFAVVVPTRTSDQSAELSNASLKFLAAWDFSRPYADNRYGHNWSSEQSLHQFYTSSLESSVNGHHNASAIVVDSELDFFSNLTRDSLGESALCNDQLELPKAFYDAYLLGMRYAVGNTTAQSCQDVEHWCRNIGMQGTIVRSLCSRTCRCNTHLQMPLINSGCSKACSSHLIYELSYFSWKEDVQLSDCNDHDELLTNADNAKVVETYFQDFVDYYRLPRNIVDSTKFKLFGCRALWSTRVPGIPESYAIKDILCGLAYNTSVAVQDPGFMTLRWVCPVSCGCIQGFSPDCPRSCREEQGNRTTSDLCMPGLCHDGHTVNKNKTVFLMDGEYPCAYIDFMMRMNQSHPQDCELADMFKRTCCLAGEALHSFCNDTDHLPMQMRDGTPLKAAHNCTYWTENGHGCQDFRTITAEYCSTTCCAAR